MRRLGLLLIYLIASSNTVTHKGGSCGRDAIPHRIAIDLDGTPVLSCDSPACIGKGTLGNQRAECDQDFTETVCVGEQEWTAGLIETTNGTHVTLRTLCCAFNRLSHAKELQTVLLYSNDTFEGGPVEHHGRMTGFDLVKEVRKSVDDDGSIQYIVSVFRMPCVDPNERYLPQPNPRRGGGKLYKSSSVEIVEDLQEDIMKKKPSLFPENGVIPEFDVKKQPVARQALPGAGGNYQEQPSITGPEVSGPEPPPSIPASMQGPSAGGANYAASAPLAVAPAGPNDGPIPPAPLQPSPASQSSYAAPLPNNYAQAQAQPAYNYPNTYAQPPVQQSYAQPPPPAYQPPPVYTGGPTPVYYSTGMKCFSGQMTVQTPAGEKYIKDLQVGDQVLSIDENMIQYSPVIMFLHKKDDVEAMFYRVQMKDGSTIELTEDHLIYTTDCEYFSPLSLVHAKQLKVGKCVDISVNENSMRRQEIVSIETVVSKGIYAPLTSTGDIFVNKVLSSCHTNYVVKSLQQTLFSVYRTMRAEYERFFQIAPSGEQQYDMPYGAEYLTSVIDLFVPKSLF